MDFCWLFFICLKLNGVKKGASNIVWNELEHPRDEIGRFAFKNGGENEEENKKEKKGDNNKKEKEGKNKQDNFSNMKPFKLGAQFDDIRTQTPAEVLYGNNSKTSKDASNQKERNKLISKLGNKLTTAQILYSSVDDLRKIDNAIQKQTLNSNYNKVINNFKYDFKSLNGAIQRYPDEVIRNNKTKYLPKINPVQINKEKMLGK